MNESQVFADALKLATPAERAAFLDDACAGNPQLRADVEALLEAHATDPGFLEQPAGSLAGTVEGRGPPPPEPQEPHQPGDVLAGRYKLVEEIGEGGMGTVWMAQQTEPVKRLVAVKLIKAGMDSKQVIARFEAERQALALMDHANIARVLDAGTTSAGRPYFVMDLVKGMAITRYCDEHHLTPRQRLELFLPVCAAVQHAHQKGIIHRDIKPSNVLVALYDGKPVPKVIDFGVAKAAGQQLTDKTLVTGFGAIVGTLEYMSPEQAEINQLDVDTRSDIYALGVLLYELLTGTTPLERKRLKRAGLLEALRIIREEETQRPSTRLSTAEELPTIAANRGTEPKKLSALFRGELDWIVMKALEKDRSRRYETANGFALDVQRYLADEPVLACPPSAVYRLGKFVRRNRRVLATAALLGAMLLVVAGSFGWLARDRAARLGRNAEAVAALLDQCEEALRTDQAERAAIALGAAERRAADGVAEDLADRLARCWADLGLLRPLDDIDTKRWIWAGDSFPNPEAAAARWRAALADYGVTPDEARAAEAAAKVNGSLVQDRVLTALDGWLATGPPAEERAGVRAVLRSADPHPYRDAVRDAVAAGDDRAVAALAGHPEALGQPARFAAVLGQLGGVPAERRRAVLESALRTRTGDLGLLMTLGLSYPVTRPEGAGERVRWFQAALAAHPGNLAALNNLGLALRSKGDLDGAIAAYREVVRLDPEFAFAHNNLGFALRRKGDLNGAIASFKEAIRLDPEEAVAHNNLGNALRAKGDADRAIACFKEAIRLDPKYAHAHSNLGLALRGKRDYDGAITAFKEAIRADPNHADAHNGLGVTLRGKGDVDGAIVSFKEATRLDPRHAIAHSNLGSALLVKGDLDGAIASFKEVIRLDPEEAVAHNNLGFALQAKGDANGALAAFREAVRADPKYAHAHFNLGNALWGKGDVDGAIASFKEAIRLGPKHAAAYSSLGAILCDVKRDYDGAITAFKEAIRLGPNRADAHFNLGNALRGKGDVDGAIASFKEAIRLGPKYAVAHNNLGNALRAKEDADGAIACFKEAIRLDPKHADAHNGLGGALQAKEDADGAIACFKEAIRLDPKHAFAHSNLAWLLATGPDRVRNGKPAVEHAARACELTGWKNPVCITTLAAAHAEAGDFDKAVEFQTKALAFADYEKQHGTKFRERLQQYARKKPYRDPTLAPRGVGPPQGKP